MSKRILMAVLVLFVSACGKSAPRDETEQDKPGYAVAKKFCTQCHALPFPNQRTPAAWPYIVKKMEGYMRIRKRMIPNESEHEAILTYLQRGK